MLCAVLSAVLSVVLCIRLSIFRPVTVVLGVAHPRETAPNTAVHGTAWFPTSPRVVANITMLGAVEQLSVTFAPSLTADVDPHQRRKKKKKRRRRRRKRSSGSVTVISDDALAVNVLWKVTAS